MGAAIVETGMGASIELKRAPATKALGSGVSGWAMRSGASGSTAVLDASNKARPQLAARSAISALVGSLLTRWAWVQAGKLSAEDFIAP